MKYFQFNYCHLDKIFMLFFSDIVIWEHICIKVTELMTSHRIQWGRGEAYTSLTPNKFPLFSDWLINWIVFYAVSATFQPYNGEPCLLLFILEYCCFLFLNIAVINPWIYTCSVTTIHNTWCMSNWYTHRFPCFIQRRR